MFKLHLQQENSSDLNKSIKKLQQVVSSSSKNNNLTEIEVKKINQLMMSQSCYNTLPYNNSNNQITVFPIEKYDNVVKYPLDKLLNQLNFQDSTLRTTTNLLSKR